MQNYQPAGTQPAAGGQQATGQQFGGLPLPPGYRPRTPPAQAQQQAQPQTQNRSATTPSGALAGSGGGGQVMYFQKPADALTATGASDDAAGVAQLGGSRSGSTADVQPPSLPPLPPSRYPTTAGSDFASAPPPAQTRWMPPPSESNFASGSQPAPRYQQPAPTGAQFVAPPTAGPSLTPTAYDMQPKPGEPDYVPPAESKRNQYKPVDRALIQLPPREEIFRVYSDRQLERATMERIIGARIKELNDKFKEEKAAGRDTKETEKQLEYYNEISKNPLADSSYQFPPLPVIGPPASAYQPKTVAYAPRKLIVEPGYYLHRKLYLEEKNAERAGWDFGPMQTLVSAAYFWKGTLTMPQNFASGFVYGHWDTSAGKCLPGSPSPYYLYPPGLTLTGTVAEGVLITGAGFIFK